MNTFCDELSRWVNLVTFDITSYFIIAAKTVRNVGTQCNKCCEGESISFTQGCLYAGLCCGRTQINFIVFDT